MLTADERGEALLARLAEAGAEVCAARPGEAFEQDEAGDFTVRAGRSRTTWPSWSVPCSSPPRTIVHGFSLGSPEGTGGEHFERRQDRGFRSALALVGRWPTTRHPAEPSWCC